MTISRDVVYDLLPAYFAGDLSADSRQLVDECLRTDPEFAAMAEKFRRLLRHGSPPAPAEGAARAEADTLTRARTVARRRGEFRGLTVGYALAAVALVVAGLSGFRAERAFIIAAAFAATALICGGGWYFAGRRPDWFGESRFW